MALTETVDERGVEETLDAVESLWLASVAGSCEIFRLAAHYADLCDGHRLPSDHRAARVLPGTERAVRLGGVGTPRVAEFAVVEFGARMRMGAVGARHLIADALDARHRLPRLYARVCAGEVRVPWVRQVASRTRHLSVVAAARVDADMVECADGRVPWSRFCARLEGRIVAADPEVARRREEEARREVFARATRSCEAGVRGFFLRGPTAVVVRFEATVAFLAEALEALGDTAGEDERRVKACLVLANPTHAVELLAAYAAHRRGRGEAAGPGDEPLPQPETGSAPGSAPGSEPSAGTAADGGADVLVPRRFDPAGLPGWLARACRPDLAGLLDRPGLLPRLTVYLHLAEETVAAARSGDPTGVLRWEGEGPVTLQYLREELAPYQAVTVTPVVDLAGQEPVDGYEIPQRHRTAVRLRTPADCFPFAANLSRRLEIDHTQAYRRVPSGQQDQQGQSAESGQSRLGNYGPLGRFHHRVKTHGGWQVAQPFDGIYVWRDPHGVFYLVDHTGTRKATPRRVPTGSTTVSGIEAHYGDLLVDLGAA